MPLTEEDYETLRAESGAEPDRFKDWDPNDKFRKAYNELHSDSQAGAAEGGVERDENEIEQLQTVDSSSSSAAESTQYEGIRTRSNVSRARSNTYDHDTDLHRSETHRINGSLESHPTAFDRIHTHRSQHFGTVGTASIRSKLKELPKFGGGKPYPPNLPEKEEYVVEFDGHDDPAHAQNWPFKKKSVKSTNLL